MATALHRLFHRLRPQPLPAFATGDLSVATGPSPLQALQQGLGEIKRYAVRLERPVSLPQVAHLSREPEAAPPESLPAPVAAPAPLMLGASIAFIDDELKARGEHPLLREMKAQAQWFQHFQSQESYEYPEHRHPKEELAVHAPIPVASSTPVEIPSHFALEALPPLLGHQRLTLTVSAPGIHELQLWAQAPDVMLEIADMQPGRWQGNTLWVESGSYEICFRMHSSQVRYSPVEVRLATSDESSPLAASAETFPVQIQELAPPSNHWIDSVPEAWREVVSHIETHGAIGEQALIHMLGGAGGGVRKARRFASALPEWSHHLPFRLEIATTSEGREYRKVS